MILPFVFQKPRLNLRFNLRGESARMALVALTILAMNLVGTTARANVSTEESPSVAYALPEFMPGEPESMPGEIILADHRVDYRADLYRNEPYYNEPCDEPTQPVVASNGWQQNGWQQNGWQQLVRSPGQDCVQIAPQGLIYRAYLAGAKQSRMRGIWHGDFQEGKIWDISLGGQTGLYRRGSTGDRRPTGFQIDIEGSTQLRLDRNNNEDLDATDYRFGIPLSWGNETYQMKFGYYHISSHVADEFLVNNPGFTRLNFVRETIIWGHSYYLNPELRFYGEVGYAFIRDVSEPWEFQFGVDYSPAYCTGTRGAPFAAFNCHLREELEFGGNIVAQIGWAWRSSPASGLLRMGCEYYNGYDDQFSFYQNSQQKLGFGAWYDF